MQKYFFIIMAMFVVVGAQAQNSFKAIVKNNDTKEPIIGVSVVVDGSNNISVSDDNGLILITNIPDGEHTITFSSIGYKKKTEVFTLPIANEDTLEIFLESEAEEIEEVRITSTRSTRTIKDIPTRVEFIAGEELEEKGNMKPGDIRMLLNESTGIQTQQTSAISANSSISHTGT